MGEGNSTFLIVAALAAVAVVVLYQRSRDASAAQASLGQSNPLLAVAGGIASRSDAILSKGGTLGKIASNGIGNTAILDLTHGDFKDAALSASTGGFYDTLRGWV